MKVELVKINLGDFCKYKFKRYEPCCDDILDDPCISFTYCNLIEETQEPIEIKTVKVIDCSEKFPVLVKKRRELLERIRAFRNSSKSDNTSNDNKHSEKSLEELYSELRRVNMKINYIQAFSLYKEDKLENNLNFDQ